MARITLCALLFALAAPSVASAQDIVGKWDVTVQSPQGATTIEATFAQQGEAITGSVITPLGVTEFKGTLIDGALTLAYSLPVQDQTLEIKMTGKVAGDSMSGTIVLGPIGEAPWSAKRKLTPAAADAAPAAGAGAAAAPPASASAGAAATSGVSGDWNISLRLPQGEMALSAALKQEGDKVTGTLSSPIGDVPVSGTMTGTALKLEFVVQTPNGDLPVTMTGELGAAGFAGKAGLGPLGEAEWTGTRKP
jgi:hypothetical protein